MTGTKISRNILLIAVALIICVVCTGCAKSVDRLIKELEHPSVTVRESAAHALARKGDPRAVDPLIAALNDEAYEVRGAAAEALGDIGDPRAVEPLIAALNDEEGEVRMFVAYALGRIGDPRAVEPLIAASNDEEKWVREGVAYALWKLFEPTAVQTFSQVCEGTGVPQAAAYQGDKHPVVLLGSSGNTHYWSDDLPPGWLPTAVEETQLVVCVGEEEEYVIQTCHYENAPSITRYGYRIDIVLREARTGEIVASTTLRGSPPRPCRETEDYNLTRLAGSHVSGSFEDLELWLQEYVVP